jgi:3-hydroxyisobutyrate dehydrogenase
MKIGIAGIGRMGAAIAWRLMGLGHELAVWNRTAEKTRALVEAGAALARTPAELVSASDLVLTLLTDAPAVEKVYLGPAGLLSGDVTGRLFIEMSTIRPAVKKSLAREVEAKGADFVDAPVGGTVSPAKEGKLLAFVGASATAFARAKPVLDQLCRRVEHLGPVGAGASMKLAINLPLLVFWQALGEALALCRDLDVDPVRLMDIFADTSGGPNVLKVRGSTIAAALKGEDTGAVTFDVDSIRKDLTTMIDEARALGTTLPVAERALECFDQAAREGLGSQDGTMLPVRWAKTVRK